MKCLSVIKSSSLPSDVSLFERTYLDCLERLSFPGSFSVRPENYPGSLTSDHRAIRPLITLTDHRGEVSIENVPCGIDVVVGKGEIIVVDFKHCTMEGAIKRILR